MEKILGSKFAALSLKIIINFTETFFNSLINNSNSFLFFIIITNRWIKIIDRARENNRAEITWR